MNPTLEETEAAIARYESVAQTYSEIATMYAASRRDSALMRAAVYRGDALRLLGHDAGPDLTRDYWRVATDSAKISKAFLEADRALVAADEAVRDLLGRLAEP